MVTIEPLISRKKEKSKFYPLKKEKHATLVDIAISKAVKDPNHRYKVVNLVSIPLEVSIGSQDWEFKSKLTQDFHLGDIRKTGNNTKFQKN